MSNHIDEGRLEASPTQFLEERTVWGVITSEKYFKWLLLIPLIVVLLIFAFYPLFTACTCLFTMQSWCNRRLLRGWKTTG